jgi:hypothetical protein
MTIPIVETVSRHPLEFLDFELGGEGVKGVLLELPDPVFVSSVNIT